jgi:hypothetical protein
MLEYVERETVLQSQAEEANSVAAMDSIPFRGLPKRRWTSYRLLDRPFQPTIV